MNVDMALVVVCVAASTVYLVRHLFFSGREFGCSTSGCAPISKVKSNNVVLGKGLASGLLAAQRRVKHR